MRIKALSSWLAGGLAIFACQAQEPVQKFASLGDFKLEGGGVIRDCRVGYRTLGTLNPSRSNAILVPTWFGETSAGLMNTFRNDKLADSALYFLILVDALGDGQSSSPSNSRTQQRMRFPPFTIRDMVESQHRLVTQILGISHLHAVMGISMGGMQTFEWVVAYPDFMDKAIPIVGSPKLTSYDLELWTAEKHIVEEDRDWKGGNYAAMPPLKALADLHDLNLTTPAYRAEHTRPADFGSYIDGVEKNGLCLYRGIKIESSKCQNRRTFPSSTSIAPGWQAILPFLGRLPAIVVSSAIGPVETNPAKPNAAPGSA